MNEELLGVRAIRFGTFELDLRAHELRKGELGLKLEAKPLQVLELLLEKAGELVTRKELRERLWPNSFVEFDRCINTAMSKLRRALGDAAGSPRYIETRSRLGYRFVAPLGAPVAATRQELPAASPDARPPGHPVLVGFPAHGAPSMAPLAAIANPKFDGDVLRFQVKHRDGSLAELSLRLSTTKDGALNIRLDFSGAGFEEARQASGQREADSDYSCHADNPRSSLRRTRP